MKSLMLLWNQIANESAIRCRTSTTNDRKTIIRRVKHEGLSFLTITLPTFGSDLQKGLDQGYVDRNLFQGFSWKGGLPLFLGGFLDLVFDRSTGVLLDSPDVDAILAIRQLTLMFGKISLPCSDTRERKAMSGYLECEQEVRRTDASLDPSLLADFRRVSSVLFRSMFSKVDSDIYHTRHVPKHGPGATADKVRGNSKFEIRTWTDRLEGYFPAGEFLLPNQRYADEAYADYLEPGAEIPVRVISVPKTLKTPRIIAVEPAAMQYAQQSILELFVRYIRRDDKLTWMIGLDNQVPNQNMAKRGSEDDSLATIDLSEASDRVSNQLVREMLAHHPHLREAVDACRSRKADLPGHGVIRLAKFASMGSALCFPIEAMVFLTIVFIGIEQELSTPVSSKIVKQFLGKVRVFGDDIIVPSDYVTSVVRMLSAFGSKVNTSKSFWNGKFRESCGKEYYDGSDVSIVRLRHVLPTERTHATEVISLVSFRNQLYWAGYWETCDWLDDKIRGIIKHYPVVLPSSPVLGRESVLGYEAQRIHPHYHSPLVKGYVVDSQIPSSKLDGQGALLKFFIKRGGLPSADMKHLERAGRPHAVGIKLRWAPST